MEKTRKLQTEMLRRAAAFAPETVDREARTVELAFSSEEPYERYMWEFDGPVLEILDHSPSSVRLGRLQDGGPLLLDHDPRRHVGVVESVAIASDRKGRAVVRFGRSAEAESALQDVVDRIRTKVSVGYMVHRARVSGKDGDTTTVLVDDWEPYEISFVSIPADNSVGVGRSAEQQTTTEIIEQVPDEVPQPDDITPIIESNVQETRIMTTPTLEQPAPDHQRRAAAIATIANTYERFVKPKDVADAIANGTSVDAFQELVMQRMHNHSAAQETTVTGLDKKEAKRFNLSRALGAAMSGDWGQAGFEREVSEAASSAFRGINSVGRNGFILPVEVLFQRDFNVGTAAEAGNLVGTDLRMDLMTDVLRNALALGQLGTLILPGLSSNQDIPRKSSATTPAFVTEIAAASESQPGTVKVTLSPKRISTFTEPSAQTLRQVNGGVDQMLRQDLIDGVNVLIENAAINGSGAGANPRGIRNVAGIGSVIGGANGANFVWSHVTGLEAAVANANAEPDQYAGYLINTKLRNTAKNTQKAANLPFMWDNGAQPLNGYRAAVSNNVPSNLTKGTSSGVCSSAIFSSDWRNLVIGLFGGIEVIVDPYSLATTGQVRLTVNAFVDVACRQPAAFATMDDALTP